MEEQEIYKIALSKYPINEYWIGDTATGRTYDQNARDRAIFIKGFKVAINYTRCCKSDSELLSCDCPICGKEMNSQIVKHHHCKECNEHYTTT